MRDEPESLDEQSLEDREWWHGPGFAPHLYMWPERKTLEPPEYQHPEDTMEIFKEYDRITDQQLNEEE